MFLSLLNIHIIQCTDLKIFSFFSFGKCKCPCCHHPNWDIGHFHHSRKFHGHGVHYGSVYPSAPELLSLEIYLARSSSEWSHTVYTLLCLAFITQYMLHVLICSFLLPSLFQFTDGYILLVDSFSVDAHLDYFQFFIVTMNKATVNILVQVFCGHRLSFLLGRFLEVEMLGLNVGIP